MREIQLDDRPSALTGRSPFAARRVVNSHGNLQLPCPGSGVSLSRRGGPEFLAKARQVVD